MRYDKIKIFFVGFLTVLSPLGFCGNVSFDQLAVSDDLTVSKFNSDLSRIYQDHNNNVQSSNIADDTITESDMADNANPRIRTNQGASCADLVVTGLLPTTTVATLVGSIPAGTVYPDGYYVNKASATPKTFTASKWTFVDIDLNGDFTYSEVAIDGSTPSVGSNSARLARVSTDGTQVSSVTDLRTTSCASGPFSAISHTTSEATLDDLLKVGSPDKRGNNNGWIQGLHVSWDTATTVKVTAGSAYINGKYRSVSTDTTVTTSTDNPAQGISGIDTGTVSASTRYCFYAVADQDSVKTMSYTYSSNCTTPAGVTNYRKIGETVTDAGSGFTSRDVTQTHAWNSKQVFRSWINFTPVNATIWDAMNVSGLVHNGTGDDTISWDIDFASADYVYSPGTELASDAANVGGVQTYIGGMLVGSLRIRTQNEATGVANLNRVYISTTGNDSGN